MERRLARALAATALVLALVSCGGGGDGGGDEGLQPLLAYAPANAGTVVVVSTDVEGDQFQALDGIVQRRSEQGLEALLREFAGSVDLSWEDDVKPLLGNELVLAFTDPLGPLGGGNVVGVFHAADADKLREVVEGYEGVERGEEVAGARLYRIGGENLLALDGDKLVYADGRDGLRLALERADGDDHFPENRLADALETLPDDALVRVYGDALRAAEIEELVRFRKVPWIAALRSFGVAVSFADKRADVDFNLNTDASTVEDGDLPLATGSDAPEILEREREVTGGNRNQSLTTAFLFRLAGVAYPRSRFVRDVHALERELGIDFEDEVLRQFDGPSASAVSVDGETFVARSTVSDPEGLQRLLPRLAPHLPRIVAGLEALEAEGQALLFLLAPDALVLQSDRVRVTPPANPGDLWRVSGLEGEGPDELHFGVIGDFFVVASEPGLARRVAEEDTVAVDGASGAGVLRVDLTGQGEEVRERSGFGELGAVGEVVAWLEASQERLRGRIRVDLP